MSAKDKTSEDFNAQLDAADADQASNEATCKRIRSAIDGSSLDETAKGQLTYRVEQLEAKIKAAQQKTPPQQKKH